MHTSFIHEILKTKNLSIFGLDCQVYENYILFGYLYFDFHKEDVAILQSETGLSYQVKIPPKYLNIVGSQINIGLETVMDTGSAGN